MYRIRSYFKWLAGSSTQFELEARVFHVVGIALTLCGFICVPINYFLSAGPLYLFFLVVCIVSFILYYLSRFKGAFQSSVLLFQLFVNAALVVNYYYNSGAAGPSYALFLLNLLLCMVMTPRSQHYFWFPLNLLLLVSLLILEHQNPAFITNTYKNNTARYMDLILSYLVMSGFVFIVASFVRKAYHRKRVGLTTQKAALEAANETKDKLLSVISHDLSGPLASLQGYLELLQQVDLSESERREMHDTLLAMTRNTSAMLSNILAWANSQGNHFKTLVEAFEVRPALANLLEIAGGIGLRKQLTIVDEIQPDAVVRADRHMFELVVRNLLMNALKFTPKGGRIGLKAVIEGADCVLSVTDNGIGIPQSLQPELFSLSTGSRWGTASEKGAGLGLRLCRDFTKLMGGVLSFESQEGLGTSFTLRLPAGPTDPHPKFTVLEKEMVG